MGRKLNTLYNMQLAILLISVLSGCGRDADLGPAVKSDFGYQIAFPKSWTRDTEVSDGSSVGALSPAASGANGKAYVGVGIASIEESPGTVVVTHNGDGGTIAGYYNKMTINYQKGTAVSAIAAFTLLNKPKQDKYEIVEIKDYKCGDSDACRATYEYNNPKTGSRRRCLLCLIIAHNRLYEIQAETLKEDYDKYAKDIDATIKSFKLNEATK